MASFFDCRHQLLEERPVRIIKSLQVVDEEVEQFRRAIGELVSHANRPICHWESVALVDFGTILEGPAKGTLDDFGEIRVYTCESLAVMVKTASCSGYFPFLDSVSMDVKFVPPVLQGSLSRPNHLRTMSDSSFADDSWDAGKRAIYCAAQLRIFGNPDIAICSFLDETRENVIVVLVEP